MEEDYILVSKDEISKLKDEISRLKGELDKKPSVPEVPQVDVSELVSKLIEVLHIESQKERELILQNLNEIKDLNKSTLDNLLTNTQKLDGQLEEMIDSIGGLVETLSSALDKFSTMKSGDNAKLIAELKKSGIGYDPKLITKLDIYDKIFNQYITTHKIQEKKNTIIKKRKD